MHTIICFLISRFFYVKRIFSFIILPFFLRSELKYSVDLTSAERTYLRSWCRLFLFFCSDGSDLVYRLQKTEKNKCHDHKIDH